jgi:cyclic pyranopterin phosphate synthase
MVDVGGKPATARVAVARGRVRCSKSALDAIRSGEVEKGDVLAAARIAGILAAKHTPEIVPLCHPIGLSGIEVELTLVSRPRPRIGGGRRPEHWIEIEARVKTVERTGVEMEALTAVCAAALCVYDMLKSRDRGMVIEEVALWEKKGGRSGHWKRGAASKK